jgi:hypothetical protein
MPARGSSATCGTRCSSAFSSVPWRLPLPGCTTRPTGLLTTSSIESSNTTSSGISSGASGVAFGIGLDLDPHRFAAADLHLGGAPGVVDGDLARADPVLDAVARELGQHGRQRLVQALAALRRGSPAGGRRFPYFPYNRRQIFCVFFHAQAMFFRF